MRFHILPIDHEQAGPLRPCCCCGESAELDMTATGGVIIGICMECVRVLETDGLRELRRRMRQRVLMLRREVNVLDGLWMLMGKPDAVVVVIRRRQACKAE